MERVGQFILTIGLVFAFTGLLTAGDDDPIKKAAKETEGTWKLVSRVADGKKVPEEDLKETRLVVKEGKWTVTKGKEVVGEGTAKILALEKGLRKVDVTVVKGENAGKTFKQLSKVEGDTYTACLAPADKERPTELASKPGTGNVLSVWKRQKP